jgi:hypothetical protein
MSAMLYGSTLGLALLSSDSFTHQEHLDECTTLLTTFGFQLDCDNDFTAVWRYRQSAMGHSTWVQVQKSGIDIYYQLPLSEHSVKLRSAEELRERLARDQHRIRAPFHRFVTAHEQRRWGADLTILIENAAEHLGLGRHQEAAFFLECAADRSEAIGRFDISRRCRLISRVLPHLPSGEVHLELQEICHFANETLHRPPMEDRHRVRSSEYQCWIRSVGL